METPEVTEPLSVWQDAVSRLEAYKAALVLLEQRPAVVLERLANGGGATNWYFVKYSDTAQLLDLLAPGSSVSFYFDDRLQWLESGPEIKSEVAGIVDRTGDAVVARLSSDIRLDAVVIAGPEDFDSEIGSNWAPRVLIGPFPSTETDGLHAITLVLPDSDGVVRPHPH